MDAVGDTAQPLDMPAHGMIVITKVQGVKIGSTVHTVVVSSSDQYKWAKGGYNVASKIGTPQWNKLPREHPQPYIGRWR